MRRLSQELGGGTMSLDNHVANKDDLLDGMIDSIFAEIELPTDEQDWKTTMRARAHSVRAVMTRHSWAIGLMESRRTPGPATLRHHDAVIGCLRDAGFSLSRRRTRSQPSTATSTASPCRSGAWPSARRRRPRSSPKAFLLQFPTKEYPRLAELTLQHVLQPGYDYGDEYDYGLSLILDGLDNAWHLENPNQSRPT